MHASAHVDFPGILPESFASALLALSTPLRRSSFSNRSRSRTTTESVQILVFGSLSFTERKDLKPLSSSIPLLQCRIAVGVVLVLVFFFFFQFVNSLLCW